MVITILHKEAKMKSLLLIFTLFVANALAQPGSTVGIFLVSTNPSGPCNSQTSNMYYNYTNNQYWGCQSSVWTQINGGVGCTNCVLNNQANTYTGGGLQNFGTDNLKTQGNGSGPLLTVGGIPIVGGEPSHIYSGPNESLQSSHLQGSGAGSTGLLTSFQSFAPVLTLESTDSFNAWGVYSLMAGDFMQGIESDIRMTTAGGTGTAMIGLSIVDSGIAAVSLTNFDSEGLNGTGTVTDFVGYHVRVLDGTGRITNQYGMQIEDQTGATNNWAIKTGLGKVEFGDLTTATRYGTATNCSSSASPAVCASAAAGSAVIAGGATTVVVNTTAVTANSQIMLTRDSSLGTKLGVTCNTQSELVVGSPYISARTGGTSFTVKVDTAPTTNPLCFSYAVIN